MVTRRRHCWEQRARGRMESIFFTLINLFRKQEHIVQTYHLPSHVIFNILMLMLLQEIKEDLEPPTRSNQAIPGPSKLLANLHFLASGSFQRTVGSLFVYFVYSKCATMNFTALGVLRWSICKWDVASVFFNLRVVSKSPAEIFTPSALFWNCALALICPV